MKKSWTDWIAVVTSGIGIVLMIAAVFLGRAWQMQTELDEVI